MSERLEEIKEIDITPLCFYLDNMTNFDGKLLKEQWKWLINRVEELEEENDELAERVHKLALGWSELVDERNRYKHALKFGVKYLQNSNIRQIQLVVSALKKALEEKE